VTNKRARVVKKAARVVKKSAGVVKTPGSPDVKIYRRKAAAAEPVEASFAEIVHLIEQARTRAYQAVNTQLVDLYWKVGEYISRRIEADGWGKGTVKELSVYIQRRQPGIRGFSPQNLWRMRQFFDVYRGAPKLSALLRVLSWSANLHILTRAKRPEEREFYLRMATKNRWDVREVARQIEGALFERAILNPPKLSTTLRELHPESAALFKDAYFLEFLGLPADHSEADLHRSLLGNLGRFLTELGGEFCYVGSEYPVQVGGQDFALDLLFFHRGLNCLVAIELKLVRFQPEHLGKLEFYLEALDRDHRMSHENPAIGVLLCASKDREVVEYALSRSLSPALVAEYQTQLPDKKLLAAKLREFYTLNMPDEVAGERAGRKNKGAQP
jgi:predicted nuclease of restriction endonuclease-like (RecB) superfamily